MSEITENFEQEYTDDGDYQEVIVGYYCLGCGHIQKYNDWGEECEQCMGMSLEPIYE